MPNNQRRGRGEDVTRSIATFLAVGVLALALGVGCDAANRRRIHAENMAKAEQFKREFDAHVSKGAALSTVEDFLRTTPVKVQRSMGTVGGRDTVDKLMIEVAGERSVHWYCGRSSVGLIAEFADERITSNYVSWRSFDCL